MKKITLTIPNATNKEKANELAHIFGKYEKFGLINKFTDIAGFTPVTLTKSDPNPDTCRWINPEIESPLGYIPPEGVIYRNAIFLDQKDEIISFIVDKEYMDHPNERFSYDVDAIVESFIFGYVCPSNPKIKVDIQHQFDDNILEKYTILTHFILNRFGGKCDDTTISSREILSADDSQYVLDVMKRYDDRNYDLSQYQCDICKSYHEDHPIHMELLQVK